VAYGNQNPNNLLNIFVQLISNYTINFTLFFLHFYVFIRVLISVSCQWALIQCMSKDYIFFIIIQNVSKMSYDVYYHFTKI
jgi:hypothetical protein